MEERIGIIQKEGGVNEKLIKEEEQGKNEGKRIEYG